MTEHPHADLIRKLVDRAPPLSDETRTQLAAIFRPTVASIEPRAITPARRPTVADDFPQRPAA